MPDSISRGHNRGSPAVYPDGNGGHIGSPAVYPDGNGGHIGSYASFSTMDRAESTALTWGVVN